MTNQALIEEAYTALKETARSYGIRESRLRRIIRGSFGIREPRLRNWCRAFDELTVVSHSKRQSEANQRLATLVIACMKLDELVRFEPVPVSVQVAQHGVKLATVIDEIRAVAKAESPGRAAA